MAKKNSVTVMNKGTIDTKVIYDTHTKIKEIVESYKDVNLRVSAITTEVNENWVGKGNTEFRSQYNMLIKKIDDFGDTLEEIYEALVKAEAEYEKEDDSIRQKFVKAVSD